MVLVALVFDSGSALGQSSGLEPDEPLRSGLLATIPPALEEPRAFAALAATVPTVESSESLEIQGAMDSEFDRIDPRTGSLRLTFRDISLPGSGGFDLNVFRTYRGAGNNAGAGWGQHFGVAAHGLETRCASAFDATTFYLPDGTTQIIAGANQQSPEGWRASCSYSGGYTLVSPLGLRYVMGYWHDDRWFTTAIRDRNGNSLAISYIPETAYVSRVSASDGREVTFSYVASPCNSDPKVRQLTRLSANSGEYRAYEYSSSCRLTTVRLPDNTAWKFTYLGGAYPLGGQLSTVTRPEGGVITYSYTIETLDTEQCGSLGTRVMTTSRSWSNGASWKYAYSARTCDPAAPAITTVRTPNRVEQYSYSFMRFNVSSTELALQVLHPVFVGRTITALDGTLLSSTALSWGLTALGDPSFMRRVILRQHKVTVPGASFVTAYSDHDSYGNPRSIVETGPNGGSRSSSLSYYINTSLGITQQVDNVAVAGADSIQREWDAYGNLLSENRNGVLTRHTYDSDGNVTSTISPRGFATNFGAYKLGAAQSVTYPDGTSVTRSVNNAGNIVSESDALSRVTAYGYDLLGRRTREVPPRGNASTTAYTATSQTTTRGVRVDVVETDGFGRTIATASDGIRTVYARDSLGRIVFASNPGSTTVGRRYTYDVLDRLIRITNADGSFRTLSYSGNSVTRTDERGHVTVLQYRSYGDPTERLLMSVTAPLSAANVSITRNARGQITAAVQAGITHGYVYDSRGYLVSSTTPETGTTSYGRDSVGNLTSLSIGGAAATTYAYDRLDRLTATNYPGATPDATLAYTKTGQVESVTSSAAVRRYAYDANDNVLSETLSLDGLALTARYGWDANDALSTITYPVSGRVVSLAPDALGRPSAATPYASALSYAASGHLRGVTLANGASTTYTHDSRLRMSGLTVRLGNGNALLSSGYGYDGASNLLSIRDSMNSTYNRTLGYDALNRLTSASGSWGGGSVSYDGVGNITRLALGSSTLNYAYASNRLASVTGSKSLSVSYNGRGDVLALGATTYQYDEASRLTCLNCASASGKVSYAYDGRGARVRATRGGSATYEFRDHAGRLLAEYTPGDGNALAEHVHAGAVRVAQRNTRTGTAERVAYLHEDGQGSPLAATDKSGLLLWAEAYRPWGERVVNDPDAANDRIAYTGQYTEGGLAHHGARYYNPMLGRFMGIDPLAFNEGNVLSSVNRYAYANNNPYRFTDRSGLDPSYDSDDPALGFNPGGDSAAKSLAQTISDWWNEGIARLLSPSRHDLENTLGALPTFFGAAKLGQAAKAAKGVVDGLSFTRSQLQHAFKHAKDFGVTGNANNKTLSEFSSVLQSHVDAAGTRAIQGTYRGNPVTHHVDPSTGLNVIRDSSGNFLSGWQLSPQQLQHVLTTGKLGGG